MRDDPSPPLNARDTLPRATDALPATAEATDVGLAARLADGDASALDALYRRHRGAVYRFALLWTGSPAIAADVTQDVFLHVLARPRDYDPERGALRPWLLGIARNFARRRTGAAAHDPWPDDDAASTPSDPAPLPVDALIAQHELERLRIAIAALPPSFRDVLVLVELAERSYAETALICGCELNTVRSRLSRARALLARWLAADRDSRCNASTIKTFRP